MIHLILCAILLCFVAIASLLKFSRTHSPISLPDDVPKSLKRGAHSLQTRNIVMGRLVTAEFQATQGVAPTQAQLDNAVGVLREAGGFHARHIWADWFYRRAIVAVLRSPTPELVEQVRNFFIACGAGALVAHIDNMIPLLNAAAPGRNWYHILGSANVKKIKKELDNIPGLLFSGHRSGNFEAGTRQDITEDTILQMGAQSVGDINREGVALLTRLGLHPYVDMINNQLSINYTSAMMNLTGPTHSGRTQETRVSPAIGLGWWEAAEVWARAPLHVQLRAAAHWAPVKMATLFVIVAIILLWRLASNDPFPAELDQ